MKIFASSVTCLRHIVWALSLFFYGTAFSSVGDTCIAYTKNDSTIIFELGVIAWNGVQSSEGSGFSYEMIDSMIVKDYADVNKIASFNDGLGKRVTNNGTILNFALAERKSSPVIETPPFLVFKRTQFVAGSQLGILLDYKRFASAKFLIRIEAAYEREMEKGAPVTMNYAVGVGSDYMFNRLELALATGFFIVPGKLRKGSDQYGFIHPSVRIRVLSDSSIFISLGARFYSKRIPVSVKEVNITPLIGIGWDV